MGEERCVANAFALPPPNHTPHGGRPSKKSLHPSNGITCHKQQKTPVSKWMFLGCRCVIYSGVFSLKTFHIAQTLTIYFG